MAKQGNRLISTAALALAGVLAAIGLGMTAMAGADEQPTIRQAGYGEGTCDDVTQTLDTKITKAPKKKTGKRTAKFEFEAFFCNFPDEEATVGIAFDCKLDKAKAKKCGSPQKYGGLKKGKHKFGVAARYENSEFGADPSPAKHAWKIRD